MQISLTELAIMSKEWVMCGLYSLNVTCCTVQYFHPQPRCLCLPQMGEAHLPLAQVVQAVLGFHADQWDPGRGADRANTTLD